MNAPDRIKTTKCKQCRQPFIKFRMEQKTCLNPECLVKQGRIEAAKRQARADRQQKHETRARLMELKPLQYWLKRAEKAVNAFIRARDKDQPCISCGTHDASEWHAGHWISVGASSALRYDPANIHKQCHQCNWFEGGNASDYSSRLPARIGQAEFERVKHAKRDRKWTREDCMAIEAEFKAKLKGIEA
jgi:hypothetical protein